MRWRRRINRERRRYSRMMIMRVKRKKRMKNKSIWKRIEGKRKRMRKE